MQKSLRQPKDRKGDYQDMSAFAFKTFKEDQF